MMMRVLIACIMSIVLPTALLAQHPTAKSVVNVNKEGLVTVNGKGAFYLVAKSIVPWESDYIVQDMNHNQLAYLKYAKGYHYTNNSNTHLEVQYYVLTFKDGAHCEVRDYLNKSNTIIKSLAIELVEAGVIKNGKVDEATEKKFVESHNGFMTPAKEDTTATTGMNNSAVPHADSDSMNGTIVLKDGFIYYEQQIIGTYQKTDIDTDLTLVQVYSVNRNKVAEVTHESGNAVWRVVTVVDQKREQVPYDKTNALKELFRYLLRKRYL